MLLSCFKAYDIRGRLGHDLDAGIIARIAAAFAHHLDAGRVVIGHDARASSPDLVQAAAQAMAALGVEVLDLGLCGTEEVYFATDHLGADGGLCITASHNPMDYNGIKLVGRGAAPLADLSPIRALAQSGVPERNDQRPGAIRDMRATRAAYVDRVVQFVDPARLAPLHVLFNAGNGAAGPTFDALAERLSASGAALRFTRLHHEPDARFPNGIPNPLLPENQPVTGAAVVAAGADLGVAVDGDFDRCFLFDHTGQFIPGEYIVGLLAEAMLARHPGAAIVHDPRVVFHSTDAIFRAGGRAVAASTGHAFIKAAMRRADAVYGGELSAHHYFRDFMFCDSGMIPWLLVVALLSDTGRSLADLVAERRRRFPSSGEINFAVTDAAAARQRVIDHYAAQAPQRDDLDGVSLNFGDWRLNLRSSNTEPLLRLNVEARGDAALVTEKAAEIGGLIQND